jgi:hypothetical protein
MKACLMPVLFSLLYFEGVAQSAGIGTTSPHATAQLDISSFNHGILIPGLTAVQRTGISFPATGLVVYQTGPDSAGFYFYTGSKWSWIQPVSNLDTLKWDANNNTGTNAALHFIGARDSVPLTIKVNKQPAGRTDTSGPVSILRRTLMYYTPDVYYIPEFKRRTATGDSALYNNDVGGSDNTGIGEKALFSNTNGSQNTAIGKHALYKNVTRSDNTAIGYKALENINTSFNTAVGSRAGRQITSGALTTAIGYNAAASTTSGDAVTAIGYAAGYSNTTGSYNTAIGSFSGFGPGTLTNATAIGANALVNTSNSLVLGNNANVGIGTSAPVEKLEVAGNIKTEGFIMAPGAGTGKFLVTDDAGRGSWGTVYREYQIAIPAQAFHAATGLDAGSRRFRAVNEVYAGNNGELIAENMYESVLEAPLIVPNGAYITGIRFFVKDNNPNYELTGRMVCYSHSNNSFTTTFSGGSGLAFNAGFTGFLLPLSNLINTVTGSYVIQVYAQNLSGRTAWFGLSLMSAVVTYTMPL